MNNILSAQNPFFEQYQTPHETVPFDRIQTEHYEPAILEGINQQKAEIEAIIQNPEKATFANTVEAFEQSGKLLDKVTTVFSNMLSAETNDELQALAQKMMPLLSEHSNNITLNEKLFDRLKEVYNQKEDLQLTQEQSRLLDDIYDSFVRHGANLEGEAREQYRQLTNELSMLTLSFSENNLKETNHYLMLLTDKADLAGLPEIVMETAAETAKTEGKEGWAFTLHAPSYVPFMTYADNRELRQKLYLAYNTKCTHDNEYNNIDIVRKIANTRMKIAQLLGYNNYADYTLKKRMAENSNAVYKLLNQLLEAYTPTAQQEYQEVQGLARQEQGDDFVVMPWDWSYYSNKLKNKKFNLNEEMLRPYFELEQVKKGIFGLAERLYGITFKKNPDIPVYHEEVEAYEVFDKDGKYLAVLYTDFHPRAGKRAGAWMTSYKEQWIDRETGENSRPHVSVVMNFTKPTANKPALLTFNEVETFLHEFGHSLHGMFANSTYQNLSGTNVYWDFVELPSQIMENFAIEKEFLHTFAKHYQTGELIPDELIQRIVNSSNFNAAYACLRQVSFGLLDMAWYTRNTPFEGDVRAYEQEAWKEAQILPVVNDACMSTQFSHIFAGGYSAGYYSYKWAEVLDADAFSLFKQKGIFNREVADSFRNNILSKGGTEHPMVLYKRFRGQAPTIDALLKRNGIK
ncbi:M3 family metallopeptidase [Bacteroides bouchesdurhonensis]|uniref:M3 family metallopeptidase n=1 Tax=Bacteroides bouchesdurhonensis TaxID=1841855 RepID=UPI0022E5E8A6|nr:M3 family metallopeptidase [Bacteroides bouchesdurhonensis]